MSRLGELISPVLFMSKKGLARLLQQPLMDNSPNGRQRRESNWAPDFRLDTVPRLQDRQALWHLCELFQNR